MEKECAKDEVCWGIRRAGFQDPPVEVLNFKMEIQEKDVLFFQCIQSYGFMGRM